MRIAIGVNLFRAQMSNSLRELERDGREAVDYVRGEVVQEHRQRAAWVCFLGHTLPSEAAQNCVRHCKNIVL